MCEFLSFTDYKLRVTDIILLVKFISHNITNQIHEFAENFYFLILFMCALNALSVLSSLFSMCRSRSYGCEDLLSFWWSTNLYQVSHNQKSEEKIFEFHSSAKLNCLKLSGIGSLSPTLIHSCIRIRIRIYTDTFLV